VRIREYRSEDLQACRTLYAQLVEHHREIYDDPTIGGEDPGAGFDEYLALPERVLTWVAVEDGAVIGATRLLWERDESRRCVLGRVDMRVGRRKLIRTGVRPHGSARNRKENHVYRYREVLQCRERLRLHLPRGR
jgi:hypothetical protein